MAIDTELLWSPVLNSIKFINSEDVSFLDTQSLEFLNTKEYLDFEGYCQKIQTGETRLIQFHANGAIPTVFIKRWDDNAVIDTIIADSVATSVKQDEDLMDITFDIYQASLSFPFSDRYYVTIETNGGANEIISEPILVGQFPETLQISIYNDANTDLNVWNDGFEVHFRVEAQLYQLKPESDRTVFRGSDNRSQVISQKNRRGIRMDIFFLPPYMHEILSYGFSLDTIQINGETFYSTSGYSEINYTTRYSLANGTALLFTKSGFGDQVVSVSDVIYIIDGTGAFITDTADENFIIQG